MPSNDCNAIVPLILGLYIFDLRQGGGKKKKNSVKSLQKLCPGEWRRSPSSAETVLSNIYTGTVQIYISQHDFLVF